MRFFSPLAVIAAVGLSVSAPAYAHPKLVSSTPAANASVSRAPGAISANVARVAPKTSNCDASHIGSSTSTESAGLWFLVWRETQIYTE